MNSSWPACIFALNAILSLFYYNIIVTRCFLANANAIISTADIHVISMRKQWASSFIFKNNKCLFGHAVNIKQINKQTNKEKTEFSNVKMPIAHHISVCFHVDGYFFFSMLFFVVVVDVVTVLFTYTAREKDVDCLPSYSFTFCCPRLWGHVRLFFAFIICFVAVVVIQFFFSANSISHLTSALTLNKQQCIK